MNPLNIFSSLGQLVKSIAGVFTPADKGKILDSQSRINEQELAGAPPSVFRLWRSIFLTLLTFYVSFELFIRPIVLFYFPGASLPPSLLKELLPILTASLGLGF